MAGDRAALHLDLPGDGLCTDRRERRRQPVGRGLWSPLADLPVVLGGTVVVIGVGVVGSVVQDLSYRALDPRVDTGAR